MIESLEQGFRKKLDVKKSTIKKLKEEKQESQKYASELQAEMQKKIDDIWRLAEELQRMDDKIGG